MSGRRVEQIARPRASDSTFSGRVGLVTRVVGYRAPAFDALAARCHGGLSILTGAPARWETVEQVGRLEVATVASTRNRHLFRGPFAVWWQEGLTDWLESWDPDVLLVVADPRCLTIGRAVRWMRARDRPVLGWGLGLTSAGGRFERLRRVRRLRAARRYDGLLAYSTRGASQYRRAGVPYDRVFVCKNAVAFRPTARPPERPPSFRGRPVLLYVGRLLAAKRVDELVRACALVARDLPDLAPELRIVGGGPETDALAALARDVYPHARLLGPARGAALTTEFARADLFVLPGQGGLAVQEAMSHGLPVIVGEADGTQDDLVLPANGWLLRDGGAAELARTIQAALADVDGLRRMGSASFDIVAHDVNVENLVGSVVDALNHTTHLTSSASVTR